MLNHSLNNNAKDDFLPQLSKKLIFCYLNFKIKCRWGKTCLAPLVRGVNLEPYGAGCLFKRPPPLCEQHGV